MDAVALASLGVVTRRAVGASLVNELDRDAELVTQTVWAGVHEYSYYARATTPGRFIVPPAKAEEMYAPETFGRSAGDVVVVR